MSKRVEIINNPYMQRLKVLINGKAVSVYSNIEKYIDEPFDYWCDKILESVYEECNGENFSLHFCSRNEETEIMEKIAKDFEYCTHYSSSNFIRSTSLLERLKELNYLIRNIRGTGTPIYTKKILFVIPETLHRLKNDLLELEVKNSFCTVESQVVYVQDYKNHRYYVDTIIIISDNLLVEDYKKRLEIDSGFGIQLGNKKNFLNKIDGFFLYESTEEAVFETIFKCLLLSPLLEVFCDCIKSISLESREKYNEEIRRLQSIDIHIIPKPDVTTIEVGKSSRIQFFSDIEGYQVDISQLRFSYSKNGIIYCNGLCVEGLSSGETQLNIFKVGEKIPCASIQYTVIKRNRIKKLKIEEEYLTIGEGSSEKLSLTFLPVDADNVHSIKWESDNEKIAKVDSYGNVRGVKKGTCIIRCFAEQVSHSCKCIVMPHLQSITVESNEIYMYYGQEKDIKINLKPDNCIDDQIIISSMDMKIINVIGRTVKAIGIGKTKIIIQNKQNTVRTEVIVQVLTEKQFKKLQKKQERSKEKLIATKGRFSKLFKKHN